MGNDCCQNSIQRVKDKLDIYKNKLNDRKTKIIYYYNYIKSIENLIPNYRLYVSEFNYQLSNIKDQLNISSFDNKNAQKIINKDEKIDLLNDLVEITNKINEFQNLLENQKTLFKTLENNFKIIQKQFNDIDIKFQYKDKVNNELIENKINIIDKQLDENQDIIIKLENNKKLLQEKQTEIENYIETSKNITENKLAHIKTNEQGNFEAIFSDKINNKKDLDNLSSSMLLNITDYTRVEEELKSIYLFREEENKKNKYDHPLLLMKNWYEICYINNEYDIHDINYELKAVGLSDSKHFNTGSFNFEPDKSIDVLILEIDGKNQTDYIFEKHSLNFIINLKNLESNKIHIIYRESPTKIQMREEEIAFRNISRKNSYGLSRRLIGENAKYILRNESDLEIINFENEFLIKTKDNEYQWGGKVPEGGKMTIVRMSKKEGIVHYYEKQGIRSVDNSSIKYAYLKIPFSYIDGNNEKIKNECNCNPKEIIYFDEINKFYEINFNNINSNTAEFILEGELKNKCKTDWVINLTKKQIESMIPPDFKININIFNKVANDIIKEYDEKHKNDVIKISTIAKIGKWIHRNIIYDEAYLDKDNITAYDTLINKRGVCDHFTKLYNALVYSLGYPALYANGYAMTNQNTFGNEDNHAWSIINIDKKGKRWLPFDATWGIFSGKLPVTHIFKHIGYIGAQITGINDINFEQIYIKGSII